MLHRVYALNIMKAVLIGLIPLDHPQTPFFLSSKRYLVKTTTDTRCAGSERAPGQRPGGFLGGSAQGLVNGGIAKGGI